MRTLALFKNILFICILSLLVSGGQAIAGLQVCSDLFTQFQEKEYKGITYKHIRKTKSLSPMDIYKDYSENDIFIGFTGIHSYFIIGDYRYDGGAFVNFTGSSINQNAIFSKGTIIRIKNLPPHIAQELKKSLHEAYMPISITCSYGVCRYLNSKGLNLPTHRGFIPSSLLKSFLKNGIASKDNKNLDFDIISIGREDLEEGMKMRHRKEMLMSVLNPYVVILYYILIYASA